MPQVSRGRYFRQLRALGAWWRVGFSVLEPQLLVESITEDDFDVTTQEVERVSTPETRPYTSNGGAEDRHRVNGSGAFDGGGWQPLEPTPERAQH